jgi:hypothetical protein
MQACQRQLLAMLEPAQGTQELAQGTLVLALAIRVLGGVGIMGVGMLEVGEITVVVGITVGEVITAVGIMAVEVRSIVTSMFGFIDISHRFLTSCYFPQTAAGATTVGEAITAGATAVETAEGMEGETVKARLPTTSNILSSIYYSLPGKRWNRHVFFVVRLA